MNKKSGFTLIELLVVISIISILSMVGFVSYQNVRTKALDAKRRADIDAIKKAYEENYNPSANGGQGGYKPLQDSMFASGKIPTPPEGGSYMSFVGPGSTDGSNSLPGQNINTNTAYKVCATLSDNTSNTSSSCATSTQGDTSLVTQVNSLSNSSCDPTGSLALGLIGYWKMDETTGTTAADSSGNNHNGTASVTGSPFTAVGKFRNAGSFNGSNVYINTGPGQVLPANKALPFTFSAWVKPAVGGKNTWRTIIGTDTSLAEIALSNDNWPVFGQNGGSPWVVNTSFTVTSDSWYHIVGVFNGTKASLYVDGELKAGPADYSFTNNHGVSLMGRYSITGGEWMNGLVDDARIYNRALSAGEVGLLYNSGNGCL